MALRTTSYDQLKKMVEGRIRNKIEGDDLDYFDALVNDAARRAYDESSYWPRFLRYEPRTVERGYIADEEDSYVVIGAGKAELNGLYQRDGDENGRPKYTLYGNDGNEVAEIYWFSGASLWYIRQLNVDPELNTYSNAEDTQTPPETGWGEFLTGSSPAPILKYAGKIEQIIEVNNSDRFDSSTISSPRYRDSISTRTTEMTNQTAWVAYKAQLDVTYGDGEEGTSNEIPSEWVRFIALDVAYAMQRGGRMSNPNETYGVAFRAVEDALNIALMNVNRENAVNILKSQGNTYFNRDYATR
ncbi:MAG: hypothetical protein HRU12_03600 [Phaeodactylibacter sp.]|nr:hypothetical protein [Phaeodactylibacter sp.]